MNEQEYNDFLNKYSAIAKEIQDASQTTKNESWFKDVVKSAINVLNDDARKYTQFIEADPSKFQSKVDELKSALSYDQALADSLISMGQSASSQTPAPSTPAIPADQQAEYDLFLAAIDKTVEDVETWDDQTKQSKRSIVEQGIQKLNDEAKTQYSEIIKQDPEKYDNAVNKLKEALSYDTALADKILTSSQLVASSAAASSAGIAPTTPPATTGTPSEPNQETLNSAFRKYMGSSFDPNSSIDKGKMEVVKNALENFQKQNNKPFDINDSEDLSKMQGIMNAAYQSEEYKKAAGVSGRSAGVSTTRPTSSRLQTSAQRKATAPASPKGGPTYYVRTGFNRYVPAVEADITSGQQLFMQNPNRAARMVYPYVKVDSRPVRRATPAR